MKATASPEMDPPKNKSAYDVSLRNDRSPFVFMNSFRARLHPINESVKPRTISVVEFERWIFAKKIALAPRPESCPKTSHKMIFLKRRPLRMLKKDVVARIEIDPTMSLGIATFGVKPSIRVMIGVSIELPPVPVSANSRPVADEATRSSVSRIRSKCTVLQLLTNLINFIGIMEKAAAKWWIFVIQLRAVLDYEKLFRFVFFNAATIRFGSSKLQLSNGFAGHHKARSFISLHFF